MIHRFALAASLALAAAPLCATTYTLEPDYAQVVFRWSHLGFSNPAAQLSQGQGTLEFDPANPTRASVQVTIPLSSLNTGVPAFDEHLRSRSFRARRSGARRWSRAPAMIACASPAT